jgi:hypothetical protein
MVSRKAAPGKGARSPSTNFVSIEPSRGERHDITQAGCRSLAEKRLGEAVAILKISRRRKAMYAMYFENYNDVRTRRRVTALPYPADLP